MGIKHFIGLGLITILFFAWLYHYGFSLVGEKYLGELRHSCNDEISIDIYQQYRQSEWKQDILHFQIKKKGYVASKKIPFASTSGRADLNDYSIHCYDSVVYVMISSFSFPWIMYDTKSNDLYPNDSENEELMKRKLFEILKEGNSDLLIE